MNPQEHQIAQKISRLLDQSARDFCIEAVEEALSKHGAPEIFNTEHGRAIGSSGHATSGQPVHFHRLHQGAGMPGNQDQPGRQRGLAGQRLRRTPGRAIKYEEVYLRAHASVSEARAPIGRDIVFRNTVRRRTRTNGVCLLTPHSSLDGKTPDQACFTLLLPVPVAA